MESAIEALGARIFSAIGSAAVYRLDRRGIDPTSIIDRLSRELADASRKHMRRILDSGRAAACLGNRWALRSVLVEASAVGIEVADRIADELNAPPE